MGGRAKLVMSRVITDPPVVILLSTFNGVPFLDQQLQSIVDQSYDNLSLIIRDDGSTDRTLQILAEFERTAARPVQIIRGSNRGAMASFFALIAEAPSDHLIMLSDQDDIWFRDKVARAVAHLGAPDRPPRLYCSRLKIVDRDLHEVRQSPLWPRPPQFENALVENLATGCTIAFNSALRDRVLAGGLPTHAIMHDWWLYLVATAFGDAIYDPQPTIRYRMHGQNAVGLPVGRLDWFLAKIRRRLKQRTLPKLQAQAAEFEAVFGDALTPENRAAIQLLRNAGGRFPDRIAFVRQTTVTRQFPSDTWALKLMQLLEM